jgi:hypothetical protein
VRKVDDKYFDLICKKLTIDDLMILGILQTQDATSAHKALKKRTIIEGSGLSEAIFRKSLSKLHGIFLIESVIGSKEHSFFINNYGILAVKQSMEGALQ